MLSWVGRLLDWNRERREWNAAHIQAWADNDVDNDTQLTPFQRQCEKALMDALRIRGLRLAARRLEEAPHPSGALDIRARLGDSAWNVLIYEDGAELTGPGPGGFALEQWDALTPDDLIGQYLRRVDAVLDGIGACQASSAQDEE